MSANDLSENELLRRAMDADPGAVGTLLERHRARLTQVVAFRMDDRMLPRMDPSDVVQEAMIEASRRLPDYLREPPLPLYVWLRQIVRERLAKAYRRHVGAGKRSVDRELRDFPLSDRSSLFLARYLIDGGTSPSGRVMREEQWARVQGALAKLKQEDQEALLLRHLEKLSICEMAAVLGISETAAKSRHFRALQRLQAMLGQESAST